MRFENFFGRGQSLRERFEGSEGACRSWKRRRAVSAGYLNRASWLRQDAAYLTNALKSETSKFVILDASCNPLVRREDGSAGVKEVIKNKSEGRSS